MIKMYTTSWCSDCSATKTALRNKGIAFEEINIEENPQAAEYVMQVNEGRRSVPTLEYGGVAASLSRFTPAKLADFLQRSGAQG